MADLQPALSALPEALEQSGLNIFCFSILKLAGRDYTSFGKCRYSFGADNRALWSVETSMWLLDHHPKLKLVCPHLGGTLPYIIGRLDHQTQVLKRGPKHLTRAPSEYLKQVWLDVASPLPLAIKFACDFMGADRLLFASDHPWVEPRIIVDSLEQLQLPEADRQKICRDNARELFNV